MWDNENLKFAAGMLSIFAAVGVFFNVLHGNGILVGAAMGVLVCVFLFGWPYALGFVLHLFSRDKDRR